MHFTSSSIALLALHLLSSMPLSVSSLALASRRGPSELEEEYYPPYLYPTTIKVASEAMALAQRTTIEDSSGAIALVVPLKLEYHLSALNILIPKSAVEKALGNALPNTVGPRDIRVLKLSCWDADKNLKTWPPLSDAKGKPVWLVIVADKNPRTGAWGVYVGYVVVEQTLTADMSKFQYLGQTDDPVEVESVAQKIPVLVGRGSEKSADDAELRLAWVKRVEQNLIKSNKLVP
ncbi:MAG: hypothetical protein M1829_000336 [Trizodia sp. TS-e1964]|nr:MAG: hypothetical protein M1829_000336 [Trizodia sp. TS-e1964]